MREFPFGCSVNQRGTRGRDISRPYKGDTFAISRGPGAAAPGWGGGKGFQRVSGEHQRSPGSFGPSGAGRMHTYHIKVRAPHVFTSSVCFADSFPSRGSQRRSPNRFKVITCHRGSCTGSPRYRSGSRRPARGRTGHSRDGLPRPRSCGHGRGGCRCRGRYRRWPS